MSAAEPTIEGVGSTVGDRPVARPVSPPTRRAAVRIATTAAADRRLGYVMGGSSYRAAGLANGRGVGGWDATGLQPAPCAGCQATFRWRRPSQRTSTLG